MTEDEAKTKWCPFARVLVESSERNEGSPIAAANRLEVRSTSEPDLDWPTPRCIGSECMAWRWTKGPPVAGPSAEAPDGGYCGLAGHPEATR